MEIVIAEFNGHQFELSLTEKDESYYIGYIKWDESTRERYYKVNDEYEAENEFWYLDDNGYRLPDEELFEKSPWTIIDNGIRKKAVQRFSGENGEARFAMQPWVRIGDIV